MRNNTIPEWVKTMCFSSIDYLLYHHYTVQAAVDIQISVHKELKPYKDALIRHFEGE